MLEKSPKTPLLRERLRRVFQIPERVLERLRMRRDAERETAQRMFLTAFRPAEHPERATPDDKSKTIAQDEAINEIGSWASQQAMMGAAIASSYAEGQTFLGYAYLALLAQRAEYRRLAEILAQEMTRKWIRLVSKGDDEDKTGRRAERIKQLSQELDRLKVQGAHRKLAEQDGYFGRAHLYIDTGDGDKPDELKTSIGTGDNAYSASKVNKKHPVVGVRTIEAVWAYPIEYNSTDPLSADWYRPSRWFVMSKEIHATRLLTYISREVPDLLKPAYSFGGLSMSQMAKPYIDNWLRTRQSVADLIHSFSVQGVLTNLSELIQADGEQLFKRAELFNLCRDNRGLMLLDKDTEEFFNVAAPLGSLDHLQAQTQEHMAAVGGIPLIKLLGITPSGLNASSDGEIRAFYDTVLALQEMFFNDNLRIVINFVMLSLWGEIDPSITFVWVPLWSLDEKGEAEVDEIRARTDAVRIDSGVISPQESRKALAAEPDSPYASLDPDDVPLNPENTPEPPDPEALAAAAGPGRKSAGASGGSEPADSPAGHEDAVPDAQDDEELGELEDVVPPREKRIGSFRSVQREDRAEVRATRPRPPRDSRPGPRFRNADERRAVRSRGVDRLARALARFAESLEDDDDEGEHAPDILMTEDEFKESDHPRDDSGKFSSSGGGGGSSHAESSEKKSPARSTAAHKPTKVVDGKRMTSEGNPLPAHVASLKIPPAWTDVTYSPDPEAHLLVTGKDAKGRRQAVYSLAHSQKQAAAKFARIEELDGKFDQVHAQNEEARKSKDAKTRSSADCTLLIMRTGIRPGSEDDTGAEKRAYGATTLEGRHVVVDGDKVSLQFVGKKGVDLDIPVEDPVVKAMLIKRKRAAGNEGKLFSVNEKDLLDHVHTLDGGGFKTKDFRTLHGTRTAMDAVASRVAPADEKAYKKAVVEVAKEVSRKLGNTPTVALQSYINPVVFAEWRAGL